MIRVIVPRRADHGHRDRVWQHIRSHYENVGEIVEGHHDAGIWNRAAAINKAAAGDWDVAVILDADTVVPTRQVESAIDHVRETGQVATAFRRMLHFDQQQTGLILAGDDPGEPSDPTMSCSRCVVIRRDFFDHLQGFDERFVGWAGEDLALWIVARRTVGIHRVQGDAHHLWHAPDPTGAFDHPCYRTNIGRVSLYRDATDAELIQLARSEEA